MKVDLRIILYKGISSCLFTIFINLLVTQQELLNIYSHHAMLLTGHFKKGDKRNLNKTPALKKFLVMLKVI